MRKHSRLSNCYTPLVRLADDSVAVEGGGASRSDGRGATDLRTVGMDTNFKNKMVAGSCLLELGNSKVYCSITGPTAVNLPSSIELNIDQGVLSVEVSYFGTVAYPESRIRAAAALSLEQTQGQAQWNRIVSQEIQRREMDLSDRMTTILSKAVPLRNYPKTAVRVHLQVLQDDGGILTACSVAASMALLDAGFELYDMLMACSVGVTKGEGGGVCWMDPTEQEIQEQCSASFTLVLLPNWKDVVLWEQKGLASTEITNQALAMCREGCKKWHKQIRTHLVSRRQQN
jgi:exosome complex component MTR3